MKKLTLLVLLSAAITTFTHAQDYKKFKVGLGLGYAMSGGDGSSGGVLVALEPAYRVSDALAIGLRLETAALTRGFSGSVPTGGSIAGVAAIGSYTVNSQYYLSANKFRPFVGAGIGLFSLASVSVSYGTATDVVASESKFGFYPRAGFDFGHFNLTMDYNLIGSSSNPSSSTTITNSYFGIRIGANFGGGKK